MHVPRRLKLDLKTLKGYCIIRFMSGDLCSLYRTIPPNNPCKNDLRSKLRKLLIEIYSAVSSQF